MGTIAVNDRITGLLIAVDQQTDFAVDFPVLKFEGAYAGVFCTRIRSGVSTTLSLADFDIVAPDDDGFTARLHVPAHAADTYQFYGKFPAGRDLAMVPGGAFLIETYEADQAEQIVMLQELRRDMDAGGGGGGTNVGGLYTWEDIVDVPQVWPGYVPFGKITGLPSALAAIDGLIPAAGKIIEFTGAGSAHLIDTPGGAGSTDWADLTGVPNAWPGTLPWNGLTSVPVSVAAIASLTPSAGQIIEFTDATHAHLIPTPAGGGATDQQPALLSSFGAVDATGATNGANDAAIASAEAAADSEIYLPDGRYKRTASNPLGSGLTKHYTGRGVFLDSTSVLPAKFSYAAAKPTTAATQGLTGWFDGDQRFSDGGEYKIIGPNVRTYDTAIRYYESNLIPHHAWLDINSGNSGVQAFLTSGANPGMGTTIPLPAAASAEWIGKTVAFASGMDGTISETRTVTNVNQAGNNIVINAALANTYIWNPAAGQTPCIFFGHRTWAGHEYVKVQHNGGGDAYGNIVRMGVGYTPKPTEDHSFMAATGGQYGGDVWADADGVYIQFFESQLSDNGHDVNAIGFVGSFTRGKDLNQKNVWLGTNFQSLGTRPSDVAHNVTGYWRNVVDTAFATLYETTTLHDQTIANAANIAVNSINGAHCNDTLTIGEPGAVVYSGTIIGINGVANPPIINVSPALPATPIAAGTLVSYAQGGAALNMKKGQRIIFNSQVTAVDRGSDPLGVFSSYYGNKQGDLIMESGTDASSDYWSIRFARGTTNAAPDTSRIRLRPTGVDLLGNVAGSGTLEAAKGLVTDGGGQLNASNPTVIFGAGLGHRIEVDLALQRFNFYIANNLVSHIP